MSTSSDKANNYVSLFFIALLVMILLMLVTDSKPSDVSDGVADQYNNVSEWWNRPDVDVIDSGSGETSPFNPDSELPGHDVAVDDDSLNKAG